MAARGVEAVRAAVPPGALSLPDGTTAAVAGEALELRDREGRLLIRYVDGCAEISAPARDLRLSAPHGRVVIEAGTDVSLRAARDLEHRAGRRVDLGAGDPAASPQLRLEPARAHLEVAQVCVAARASRLATVEATVVARSITTTAAVLAQSVGRYELTATKIVEKARDVFRDASGLVETRVGRARTLVEGVYSLCTGRSVLTSKEETSIDGKKILLG